ncbi:bis(5'-nucleosyl)-tetraphosphatase PrpE [Texcoconibacillus texcoconensis]|uniref:Diadenosine tetraphosphatase ApaH/serine/threonine PP2A family protein phosphatase n=1 Tax=Texcoconibacillus texcoconensis TaxID=1095777 RepID=A0A840QTZ5_9BACI|nr:bis(5'-nucleosyl)-tetraphosphatase PrpE [Texcoconibacillus texcoconensis]MBB5174855.1 diadenosine tetraphosphatase ApaH/serine/threonine PP2A family protein phosphatase [Texcoconibacillus texcoconensis]
MYDIIGDIHGCYEEMIELFQRLGYKRKENHYTHPDGRQLVFLGDLTDRGPASIPVIEAVGAIINTKNGLYCPGNHCDKLYRYFIGRNVKINNGLETTVAEWKDLNDQRQSQIKKLFCDLYEQSPLYHVLDDRKLVVAHAGVRPVDIGRTDKKVKTFVLYGDITGEKHEDGRPVRRDWAANVRSKPLIVYGHTPVKQVRGINNTLNIDTGCVFGGKLTAFCWPEHKIVDVSSKQPYQDDRFRTFNNH